jgi:hypothetical protein
MLILAQTSPGTTATAVLLLAMSLEPTATVLAAAPPTAAPTTGLFRPTKVFVSSLIYSLQSPYLPQAH